MQARGSVIERARIEHGWTRRQLGRYVGISYQHVYNIERGHKGAAEPVLKALATALSLPIGDIAVELSIHDAVGPAAEAAATETADAHAGAGTTSAGTSAPAEQAANPERASGRAVA